MNVTPIVAGSALAAGWGVAHLVPTRQVVASFGALTDRGRARRGQPLTGDRGSRRRAGAQPTRYACAI